MPPPPPALNRLRSRRRLPWLLVLLTATIPVVALLLVRGHFRSPFLGEADSSVSSESVRDFGSQSGSARVEEVGTVMAGEIVLRELRFVNDTPTPIEVKADGDIRVDCGCSSMTVAPRRLEPGETAIVGVTIKTQGKKGPFADGGSVTWTDPAGKQTATNFKVSGNVRPVAEAIPALTVFDDRAVKDGTIKEIRVRGNAPIDWSRVTVRTADPLAFEIVDIDVDAGDLILRVRAQIKEQIEFVNGRIILRSFSPILPEPELDLVIPLQARQHLELSVQPKILSLRREPNSNVYSAAIIVHRESTNGELPIKAMTIEGGRVDWVKVPADSARTTVLRLTVTPLDDTLFRSQKSLDIETNAGNVVSLQIVVAPSP